MLISDSSVQVGLGCSLGWMDWAGDWLSVRDRGEACCLPFALDCDLPFIQDSYCCMQTWIRPSPALKEQLRYTQRKGNRVVCVSWWECAWSPGSIRGRLVLHEWLVVRKSFLSEVASQWCAMCDVSKGTHQVGRVFQAQAWRCDMAGGGDGASWLLR